VTVPIASLLLFLPSSHLTQNAATMEAKTARATRDWWRRFDLKPRAAETTPADSRTSKASTLLILSSR
jgi:hypothetical protein